MRDTVHSVSFVSIIISRDTGTITTIGSSGVRKRYTSDDRAQRVRRLKNVYSILKDKAVPNVDSLLKSHIDHPHHGCVVCLKPKRVDVPPRLAQEVKDAVRCILEFLVVDIFFLKVPGSSIVDILHRSCTPIHPLSFIDGQMSCRMAPMQPNGT